MLDINLFRADKGGNPDIIRESQRSRFAPVELVDEVIALDKAWRESKSTPHCPNPLKFY
jgi:seryl-tRNA synthetase